MEANIKDITKGMGATEAAQRRKEEIDGMEERMGQAVRGKNGVFG